MNFWSYRPYVPVAKRRAQAAREVEKLKKKGRAVLPVIVEGRKIAQSFWGKAWCDNLERYSDFENRLPRGRSYVRTGSVVDLQITRGSLHALVSGSNVYEVKIDIALAKPERWKAICRDCASSIGSLVELLKGQLSKQVMERVCRETDGLFPVPREIKMSCSCPDWADMCKHVAATLYGAGARLDSTPELLFTLRGVDSAELIASAGDEGPLCQSVDSSRRVLAEDDVAALFGIEMTAPPVAGARSQRKAGKQDKEKSAGVSAERLEKNVDRAVRTTKKVTEAPSAQEIATKSRARTKAKQTGGSTPADPAKGKIASTMNRGRRASKAIEAHCIDPPTKITPPRRKQRKNEQAAGRTRAAKWIGAKARKTRE